MNVEKENDRESLEGAKPAIDKNVWEMFRQLKHRLDDNFQELAKIIKKQNQEIKELKKRIEELENKGE